MYIKYVKLTEWLDKFSWMSWLILILALAFGIGTSIDAPMGAGEGGGRGYVVFDVMVTAMLWSSVLLQLVVQIAYGKIGNMGARIGRWLVMCAMTIFAARFTWLLIGTGDIYGLPVTMAGFGLLAVGQIVHSIGVLAQVPMPHRRQTD